MAELAQDGLFFDGIVKSFGGTHALRGVSLQRRAGRDPGAARARTAPANRR